MNKHMSVLALLAASFLNAPIALADASASPTPCTPDQAHPGNCDGLRGQIADDSATFKAGPGENTEFKTPLEGLAGPSHVAQRDLQAMRDSEASLPTKEAVRTETLSDADLGALFESGRDELLLASKTQLDRIADSVRSKTGLRFLIVGHADNQHLSPRARALYRDNQGLSEARAFQVAQYLRGRLGLPAEAFTIRGEGDGKPVADNATPAGMAKNRRVELELWYDQTQTTASPAPVARMNAICGTEDTAAPAPLRITIDGKPATPADQPNEADHQRCVDVEANHNDIQIQFDPLKTDPALNVTAWPNGVVRGETVEFSTYSNYVHWIRKAEIRFFTVGQDSRERPFLILPVTIGATLGLTADARLPATSVYTLRVYDEHGRFDETALKPLTVLDHPRPIGDESTPARERLTGYGQSTLRIRNITVNGGSVTVSGRNAAKGEVVHALGTIVPVDEKGRFVVRQLLPAGTHTVNVDIDTPDGGHTEYARNLTIAPDSWFYVALGELTVSPNHTTGPALLVTQDTDRYGKATEVDGRGAFYAKGKVNDDYLVTLSVDTTERPIENLFTNVASKDPRFLLERIDADKAYPVYGDDSTSEWDAPTNGQVYARVEHNDSRATWGNFQTAWTGLELNQFSRSLYGGELLLKSDGATSFGERRSTTDAFGAEPGTLDSREEFRGTGGSLYYLHRQDITRGSERLWIEIRDQTSSIALQRTQLVPGLDYDLNYLQGTILLRAPLSAVADGSGLVQIGSLSGNPAYLVTTYEYSPGLNAAQSNVYGLRNSTWLNDFVRVGMSGYRQGEGIDRQIVGGLDATLRYRPATYLDLEFARSDGTGSQLNSIDGGFGFNQTSTPDALANAKRLQGAIDLSDIWQSARGRGSVYWQDRQAGFSGAGALATTDAIRQQGAAFSVPLNTRTSIDLKTDDKSSATDRIDGQEASVHYQMNDSWGASVGARYDDRHNDVANASTLLSENGARTDAIVRFDYKPPAPPKDPKSPQTQPPALKPSPATAAISGTAAATAGTATAALAGNAALGSSAVPAPTIGFASGPLSAASMQPGANTYDVTHASVPAQTAADVAARPASWQAYTYVQDTLARSGDREENDRVGVGAQKQINDHVRLGSEISEGSGGFGGLLTGDYRIDDRSNVYLAQSIVTERDDSTYQGRFNNTVVGSRVKLSDQVSIYDEARDGHGAGPQSATNAFGVDLAPNDRWNYGAKWEAGTVSDPVAGDLTSHAMSVSAAYKVQAIRFASNLEFRHENGTAGERDTWLSRNTGSYQASPDWRLMAKANFSFSSASQGNFYDGNFVDASLGGAFRPVANDRWNTLLQYRYYYTLPSPGQVGLTDSTLDYAQRSHVISFDSIYDILPWLSLGGKYAQRYGELQDTRVGGAWLSSRADLIILRGDVHIVRKWDIMIEGRQLTVFEAQDRRSGLLLALYRHMSKNVKLGVGYNCTDYSDDLTDLSYRSRGPFVNIMSTF
jgi:outer membrane protein OmpA-like peptidoglycan-associated protein